MRTAPRRSTGDCFAYALPEHRNLPLLFKGDDFVESDLAATLRPLAASAPHWTRYPVTPRRA